MTERNAVGKLLAILGASATIALGVAGCVPRNDDIDRVQPGYVRKAIFQTEDEWYYRRTIAKSETTQQYIIEGHGDIALDRIKFEVQEDYLIAYKPYEAIPGIGYQELEGNTFYKGTILAAWPITSHFDIIRQYDALTGNDTNLIVENAVDRPWHERDYIRVAWNDNQIEGSYLADTSGYWIPVSLVTNGDYWVSLQEEPTDPYASRFAEDYVEVTNSSFLAMDLLMCAAFTGYSYAGYTNCGYGEAKVRHSFRRIKTPSDYIPRNYPDSVVRKGADGKPIYDPDTGEVERVSYYNRFGIFRIEVPTYDRGYGTTESGRLFRAMLFNLWERHTDDSGQELPYSQRTEKPIVYYLNADFPERYWKAAETDANGKSVVEEVAEDYSRIFTNMVADLKGVDASQVKDMFQIKPNDCNEDNIVSYVGDQSALLHAVRRAVCREGEACPEVTTGNIRDVIGVGNLMKVCTSLEAATMDLGDQAFSWQRIGDARYNMLVYLNNPQRSPWGGYGPMHADARTGETVSATSFIRGVSYEVGAANVVDYIEYMRDEKTTGEIIYGQDIRRHIADTLQRKGALSNMEPAAGFMDRLDGRMDRLGATRDELLQEAPNSRHQANRLERIKGTPVEERVLSMESLAMAGSGTWHPTQKVTDELKDRASPLGMLEEQNPLSSQHAAAKATLGAMGYCFLEADFDPHWAGMAKALEGLDRKERYRIVRERMVKHVILHELGHNVGLAHNFEGTYDALNYNEKFWNLQSASAQEKRDQAQDEFRQTSVMEYIAQGKGAFGDFMGKYDEAALRFAYGNQVQVFDGPNVDTNLKGGEDLRAWRYLNDYTKIPDHLCGPGGCADEAAKQAVLSQRKWVNFDPQNPPAKEVPYLFCDNAWNRLTPFCATFDYGSNMREIGANYYSMWSDYFFFNNFVRNRLAPLSWTPTRAMIPAQYAMDYTNMLGHYFYYLNVTGGEEFRNSDLREDMATALANGINLAAEIVSTPRPERMCPWPNVTPPIYISHRFFRGNTCDEYAPIDSAYAIDAQAIDVPLGDSRPVSIGLTEDYEEWGWAYVGSFFDKTNVIYMLGYRRPTLQRFNYSLDFRNYYINLYRLFEPELLEFYDGLMNLDGFFIREATARTLGSYWCRDTDNPNSAYMGHFEPRKLLDPVTNTSLPGPSANCTQPATIMPAFVTNTPFNAMLAAHALFSSDFDAQLDMGKQLKIYVKGADDDYISWGNLPDCESAPANSECICTMVDSLTGLEYRGYQGLETPEPGQDPRQSLACRLVEFAKDAQSNYEQSQNDPRYKDNWREWVERLEYARQLYRIFHVH